MKKLYVILVLVLVSFVSKAQKVDSIYFNLYTDSLKKGVHNYINLDGKLNNGNYLPLTNAEITLSSSYVTWEGCSMIIDSAYNKDSVIITSKLKDRPEVQKSITIFIKKIDEQPALKSEKELMEERKSKGKKKG